MFWNQPDVFSAETGDMGIEALQTDIQRFIAIIAFCLMAIFALVQAIPVTKTEQDQGTEKQHLSADLPKKERVSLKPGNQGTAKDTSRPAVAEKGVGTNQEGPSVAFASDGVFLDLMRTGKIALFIQVTGMMQVFQAVRMGETIAFSLGRPARDLDLWEIKRDMVPQKILDAFRRWTALAKKEKMVLVGLSPEISRRIRGRNVTSGRFIIMNEGRVSYHPTKGRS